ncbi:hypothetical protein C3F39_07065 [Klebsiella pneumoniae]|nr:hypothetical protein C3F39_07065 [Klebsiella pneumoniae]
MMSLWDALRMNMMISYQELVRTFLNFQLDGKTIDQRPLVVLQEIPEGNFFGKIIDYIKLMFHHWFG